MSRGQPFDIEDFGIALSAGLTCPKHGWSFDIFNGRADRGNYKLGIWEVRLSDVKGGSVSEAGSQDVDNGEPDKEVWVRRKQRIG